MILVCSEIPTWMGITAGDVIDHLSDEDYHDLSTFDPCRLGFQKRAHILRSCQEIPNGPLWLVAKGQKEMGVPKYRQMSEDLLPVEYEAEVVSERCQQFIKRTLIMRGEDGKPFSQEMDYIISNNEPTRQKATVEVPGKGDKRIKVEVYTLLPVLWKHVGVNNGSEGFTGFYKHKRETITVQRSSKQEDYVKASMANRIYISLPHPSFRLFAGDRIVPREVCVMEWLAFGFPSLQVSEDVLSVRPTKEMIRGTTMDHNAAEKLRFLKELRDINGKKVEPITEEEDPIKVHRKESMASASPRQPTPKSSKKKPVVQIKGQRNIYGELM